MNVILHVQKMYGAAATCAIFLSVAIPVQCASRGTEIFVFQSSHIDIVSHDCYTRFVQDEGNFVWVDGSPLNFTNYRNGSQGTNTSDNNDCVVMQRRNNGKWGDISCNFSREFLCRESKPFSFSCVL